MALIKPDVFDYGALTDFTAALLKRDKLLVTRGLRDTV